MVTVSSFLHPTSNNFLKKLSDKSVTPLQALAERDPERARTIQETHNQLRQTLDSLKSSQTDIAEQRKAIAQQKIQHIKEQIKTLRMMSSMDPKIITRQLAQLSKELASAIKDYASAGGTAMIDAGAGAGAGIGTPTSQHATSSDAHQKETPQQVEDFTAPTSTMTTSEQDQLNHLQNTVFSADNKKQQTPILPTKNPHDAFISEVKKLADEIKIMLRLQKARLKHDTDPFAMKDVKETERALRDIDQTLRAMPFSSSADHLSSIGMLNISV
jgi:hypothetical protein